MANKKTNKDDKLTLLALRMKKGDRKAASELFDDLSPKVYGFFFSRTGKKETAEDLSQDIFLKLVEKVESFDAGKGRFVVWFWQMARNMLIDHYRSKKEVPFSAFAEDQVESLSISETVNVDSRLHYRKVQNFLATLNEDEKELFELRYVSEMPYRDIATLLDKSEGSLRVASLRVKEKIRKELKHEA